MFTSCTRNLRINNKILFKYSVNLYTTQNVRVRFAPSPTGYLHLGGLRTALYNFLFAKAKNGKFILRIEDTDQTRLVDGATEQLQQDLLWSGIEIHEGPRISGEFGPYIQSERLNIYREQVQTLLDNGTAYQCFCTDKRLDLLRKEALRSREVPKYDNRCRHLSKDEINSKLSKGASSCIRFKITPGISTFNDLVYGKIAYDISLTEGDPVIMKSDGYPTYHFANVVDDHCMEISHVLRGVEWQISTTKHIQLYNAFNWKPPVFGHLPLLMNADGSKLSKRQGDIKISYYRENGIFPSALLNFIVHSGGGFQKDLERQINNPKCYTINELAKQFDIEKINAHSGKLMNEKLLEYNSLELKQRLKNEHELKNLIHEIKALLNTKFSDNISDNSMCLTDEYIKYVLEWAVKQRRITKLTELVSNELLFLWITPKDYKIDEKQLNIVKKFTSLFLEQSKDTTKDELNTFLKQFSSENDVKFSDFMKIMRRVLSGLKEGPGVADMIMILGKRNTLKRLETCLSNNK